MIFVTLKKKNARRARSAKIYFHWRIRANHTRINAAGGALSVRMFAALRRYTLASRSVTTCIHNDRLIRAGPNDDVTTSLLAVDVGQLIQSIDFL